MTVHLVWATPNSDAEIAYCARVSNPANQGSDQIAGLIRYMIRHGHWSPFEMVSACLEIETTRDIGRQILRHRSFSYQEFSQRYQTLEVLPATPLRETRMQDPQNRQSSLPCDDSGVHEDWARYQREIYECANAYYRAALAKGIAKEQARALLPEGLTPSRMYMSGTLRSWIHYLQVRLDPATQKEHREIAEGVREVLARVAPVTMNAVFPEERTTT